MALPTHYASNQASSSTIGTTYGIINRFRIQSSDVIEGGLRIEVIDQRSGRTEWHQERSLTETEIVESLVHVPTKTLTWTTHRPTQGWYIQLRSPALPQNAFIPLKPCAAGAASVYFPMVTDLPQGCFTFSCRTMLLDLSATIPSTSLKKEHVYPPSSPRDSISSASTLVPEDDITGSSSLLKAPTPSRRQPPASQITHFLIIPEPHLVDNHEQPVLQQQESNRASGFFSALGKKLVGAVEHKKSFTIKVPSGPAPSSQLPPGAVPAPTLLTLLTFHDTTPALTLGTPTTGTIELDEGIARLLGVDKGFYIAACLAFLEFLADKEGYLAASND